MNEYQQLYEVLRKAVAMVCGYTPHTIHDFRDLSAKVENSINRKVSDTTLRRFWGYQETYKHINPSRYTLDVLAIYAGFKSWDDFCECQNSPLNSNSVIIYNDYIHASDVEIGSVIRLTWKPDRQMYVRYLGDNMWIVDKSVNSKLTEGYIFSCASFIKNLPLVLTDVTKEGCKPTIYRCGTEGGIDFHIER